MSMTVSLSDYQNATSNRKLALRIELMEHLVKQAHKKFDRCDLSIKTFLAQYNQQLRTIYGDSLRLQVRQRYFDELRDLGIFITKKGLFHHKDRKTLNPKCKKDKDSEQT